ncbi:hypothetical protein PtB15_13B357 [Puccinia triticina]|nr:hypothetical protein PtB15_13B357 [Puccinia triticina]
MVSVKLAQLISIAVFASTCMNIQAGTLTTRTVGSMPKPNDVPTVPLDISSGKAGDLGVKMIAGELKALEGSPGSSNGSKVKSNSGNQKKPKPPVTRSRRSPTSSLSRRNRQSKDSPPRVKAIDSGGDGFKQPLHKRSGSSSETKNEAIPKEITGKPTTGVMAKTGDIAASNGAATGNSKPPTIRRRRESSIGNVVWKRQHPAGGPHLNGVEKKLPTEHKPNKRNTEPTPGPPKREDGKKGGVRSLLKTMANGGDGGTSGGNDKALKPSTSMKGQPAGEPGHKETVTPPKGDAGK